ncbi:MAG: DNA polymerase Y family protein, partial [Rhodocyclaceae bacterium]
QQRVVCANEAAAACGIVAGMRLAGALGLAPGLVTHECDGARQAALMHQLACWAGGYSPQVSLAGSDELLVEISGCLRLFGGLRALCRRIGDDLDRQGFSTRLSLAPTATAAQWLARAGQAGYCLASDHLTATLAPLDAVVLGLPQGDADTLATLGVRTLGDLLALPRDGLARRFGPGLPLQLARALGEAPDLRVPFAFPETFSQKLELPAKVDHAPMLLFAARRLLASLAGWLGGRAAGVSECVFQWMHEDIPPTRLALNFADVTSDLARMEGVLRERLERCTLAASVTDIRLDATTPVALSGTSSGLFAQTAAQSLGPVVERLRARLGKDAVHGLAVCADHRPERATRHVPQGEGKALCPAPPRPLWLLPAPQSIQQREDGLFHRGRLRRLAGPERIESGWWDHGEQHGVGDLRRDYYVALSAQGQWLWIFRDAHGWWLHGHFA